MNKVITKALVISENNTYPGGWVVQLFDTLLAYHAWVSLVGLPLTEEESEVGMGRRLEREQQKTAQRCCRKSDRMCSEDLDKVIHSDHKTHRYIFYLFCSY